MKFSLRINSKIKIIFLIITTLLILLSWLSSINIITRSLSYGDEGFIAQAASRVLSGEVPYRDFFLPVTPGSAYYHAAFLSAFGSTLLSLRIGLVTSLCLIYAGGMWALWHVGVRQVTIYILLAFFLSFFGGPAWFIASHHWLAQALCILSLGFLLAERDSNQKFWKTSISGILALLVIFTLQHKGILWTLAVAISFLFLSPSVRRKRFTWFLGGWLVVAVPLVIYFFYYVGYDNLYDQLISWPLNNYHNMSAHRGTLSEGFFDSWTRFNGLLPHRDIETFNSFVIFVTVVSLYILPFAGLFALIGLYLTKSISTEIKLLLSAYFFTNYVSALHRLSFSTLLFVTTASLLPVLLFLAEIFKKNNLRVKYRAVLISFIMIFFCMAPFFSMAKLYAERDKNILETKAGKLSYLDKNEFYSMMSIYNKYMSLKKDGDEIFCYRYLPMVYFIFGEENKTPFDILVYPMNTQDQLDTAQNILEERKVRFIFWGNGPFNSDSLGEYIRKNYKYITKKPYVSLLERI